MTVAKAPHFKSFEEYLTANPSDLPEGRFEYWNGELVPVMSESGFNALLANCLFMALVNAGVPIAILRPHSCEVEVIGTPRTRFPDLTVLEEVHVTLLNQRERVTRDMPPPRLLVEVVSPGDENSDNYQRDYIQKVRQYAAINVPEYWLIDPDRAVVKIGRLVDGSYQFQDFTGNQLLVSSIFPNLNLTAVQILSAGQ
ncbi:Uma2 family endonuclease [filamentous cyanobacterium LEGE 11480]|uniref:Uma2 family endonuclease n=1 Tax=Romeriopsis navalis LEGE 11480 TaxID=2777977 RepID=A0A928VVF6_9CYAN|nr:Uma2 family endonuclease [Romeriopsis navalis]MBE9033310.1 Uma2 family endonuclease [Romeriopsis navalis LEGE 11480]